MIPVRVPADMIPVLADDRPITMADGHPLTGEACPVCDGPLGYTPIVLVFAGISPEHRKQAGQATGAAVAVHAECAGTPAAAHGGGVA